MHTARHGRLHGDLTSATLHDGTDPNGSVRRTPERFTEIVRIARRSGVLVWCRPAFSGIISW